MSTNPSAFQPPFNPTPPPPLPYDPSTPPPPPPKPPRSHNAPPTHSHSAFPASTHAASSSARAFPASTHATPASPTLAAAAPAPEQGTPAPTPLADAEDWIPEILLDKPYPPSLPPALSHPPNPPPPTKSPLPLTPPRPRGARRTTSLTPLLTAPALLAALSSTHPSLRPPPLLPLLSSTVSCASQLSGQHARLSAQRAATQTQLLRLHGLERQWRAAQERMDAVLEPWSGAALYRRLGHAERDAQDEAAEVEAAFLAGLGTAAEREVGAFVERFCGVRGVVGRRREARARWDEGRVGGWR